MNVSDFNRAIGDLNRALKAGDVGAVRLAMVGVSNPPRFASKTSKWQAEGLLTKARKMIEAADRVAGDDDFLGTPAA